MNQLDHVPSPVPDGSPAASAVRRSFPVPGLHTLLLLFCTYVVASRMFTVIVTGGWADRAQFFVDGDLRPGMVDFIFNEVMIYYLLIRVIIYKFSPLVCLLIIGSGFAYYTRVPIILLFFALLVSAQLSMRVKFWAGLATFALSFALLYLRLGDDLLYGENSTIFYLTYPLIGIARVWETSGSFNANPWHYATLVFKPLDAIMFMIDYLGMYGGQLSAGRYSGLELSQFEYIQSLQGAYNAFGTVLYPFVYIAGWRVGLAIFVVFLVAQYTLYLFATQSKTLTRRFMLFLLISGLLFSWTSPFVWMTPLIFTRFRHRRRGRSSSAADPNTAESMP